LEELFCGLLFSPVDAEGTKIADAKECSIGYGVDEKD
jgi:hypothetical protein